MKKQPSPPEGDDRYTRGKTFDSGEESRDPDRASMAQYQRTLAQAKEMGRIDVQKKIE